MMLPQSTQKIVCDPDIQAPRVACEDIDVELRHLESIESNCAVFSIKNDHNRSYRRYAAVG